MSKAYVKICGITNTQDALLSAKNGATHLGIIFHPESKRDSTPDNAKKIEQILNKMRLLLNNNNKI